MEVSGLEYFSSHPRELSRFILVVSARFFVSSDLSESTGLINPVFNTNRADITTKKSKFFIVFFPSSDFEMVFFWEAIIRLFIKFSKKWCNGNITPASTVFTNNFHAGAPPVHTSV